MLHIYFAGIILGLALGFVVTSAYYISNHEHGLEASYNCTCVNATEIVVVKENCTQNVQTNQSELKQLRKAIGMFKYLMSREKLHPDRVDRNTASYAGKMVEIAQYYALKSRVVAVMAELTKLRKDGNNYVLAWFDGSDVRVEYVSDVAKFSARDIWQDPDFFFLNGMSGDCEDFAIAMAALLAKKGYNISLCVGYAFGQEKTKQYQHAWLQIEINGSTYYGEYHEFKYMLFAKPITRYVAIECHKI